MFILDQNQFVLFENQIVLIIVLFISNINSFQLSRSISLLRCSSPQKVLLSTSSQLYRHPFVLYALSINDFQVRGTGVQLIWTGGSKIFKNCLIFTHKICRLHRLYFHYRIIHSLLCCSKRYFPELVDDKSCDGPGLTFVQNGGSNN